MRVIHVLYLSEWPGQNPISGAEGHVLTLVSALAARGVDVELIALLWGGGQYRVVEEKLGEVAKSGVRVTRVYASCGGGALRTRLGFARAWAQLARLLRARPSGVVHLHLDLRITPLVARIAGRQRVVLSIHNDEPFYSRASWKLWLRLLDLLVDRYIGITDHVSNYYRQCAGIAPEKIDSIHYGIPELTAVCPPRAEYGLAANEFVVGFVGRLTAQKNLTRFIQALGAMPDVTGVLVGDGPDRAALESLVSRRGLRNIRFLGSIPEASRMMPLFDVLCLPSIWEGLGLVLLEAMMQGVPVIGSRRGAIPEIVRDGIDGVLFEPTVDGIVAALQVVRSDYTAAVDRAARAAIRARTSFGIERMVSSTMETYARASRNLDEPRRP